MAGSSLGKRGDLAIDKYGSDVHKKRVFQHIFAEKKAALAIFAQKVPYLDITRRCVKSLNDSKECLFHQPLTYILLF